MPWIDKSKCTGCGICVEKCPVDAIVINEKKATINTEKCIRCGKCHEVCPQEAIRHDRERIPFETKEKLKEVKKLIKNFGTNNEKNLFLKRMVNYYNKEKEVADKVVAEIKDLQNKLK